MFNAKKQLKRIVRRTFEFIEYERSELSDVTLPNQRPFQKTVHLCLCTDGVSVCNSRSFSIWPVWLAILNLPPWLRSSVNIILGALHAGHKKPDFDEFLKTTLKLHNSSISVQLPDRKAKFKVNISLVVADMPAKAALLFHTVFCGRFACPTCLEKGVSGTNGTGWYYHFNADFELRTNERFIADSEAAQASG